jgi:cystathionine beta-lyase/cystathionine gamma-synthase
MSDETRTTSSGEAETILPRTDIVQPQSLPVQNTLERSVRNLSKIKKASSRVKATSARQYTRDRHPSCYHAEMKRKSAHLETKLIHAGEPAPRIGGAVSMPVFQSANFEYRDGTAYHDLQYIRLSNTPNHVALHRKLAALENAESALTMASGMAAISTSLLALLSAGDHLLIQSCLYGGTRDLVTKELADFGIAHDFIDPGRPRSWDGLMRPSTKVIFVEAMSNPLLETPDLEAEVRFAKAHGLVSAVDNTFPSPVNFRPAEWGFDLSLHCCT